MRVWLARLLAIPVLIWHYRIRHDADRWRRRD